MEDIFKNYIQSISSKFSHEETTEMGYRTDFEILLKSIFKTIKVTRLDHDARAIHGNKPDFVVLNYDIPILYIETKNIGISLDKVEKSEQMRRYYGYTNLVLTDYLEFRFYRNGLYYVEPIKIAEYNLKTRTITSIPENSEYLARTLIDFTQSQKEPIKSGEHLAKIMGGKAQRIRDNIKQFLSIDSEKNEELLKIYKTIKKLLVHDLNINAFADMYAQTLVYGLFAARYHDESPASFTRQEARDLIPKSNPLLRHFFDHIVGPNFDKRLEYIVNELCEVFSHADVHELMREYYNTDLPGEEHKGPDPVIHFYEDFLKEYDPILRKKMGAYYTPVPVVQFIVRSVDYLLKKEFGLTKGLADTSKTATGVHRVQILDPAVGTGTFINAVINIIYSSLLKSGQKGRWPTYVHNDLLPRLYGFELMMAPYTIAHLKLAMTFGQTGFKYFNRRLGIYLTNSLEKAMGQGELFTAFGLAESIAEESKEAAIIKNETPIMVVIGNPPYSSSSSNKGEWIQDLIKEYKKNLGEKKINIDDDYIKFIRLAENFIEKNKNGIVAMITNNSFIDGITHRQMRKHLLETFDDIYILDLHGDAKEKSPSNAEDENIFNIKQGVSISLFVRKSIEKKELGSVHHAEIYGKKMEKFKVLDNNNIKNIKWNNLFYMEPYYFFVPKDFSLEKKYVEGFKVTDLFLLYSSGIQTKRDKICIQFNKNKFKNIVKDFNNLGAEEIRQKYNLPKDGRDWKIKWAKEDIKNKYSIESILYRPFDVRYTIYTGNSKGFLAYPREKISKQFAGRQNIGLITNRQIVGTNYSHIGVTDKIICHGTFYLGNKGQDYLFPLYIYSEGNSYYPNFREKVIKKIERMIGKFSPEDILFYVYVILHSPNYREKYKEFLKIDFPRIPYPKDIKIFRRLVALGSELCSLHLLESPKVNQFITTYPIVGSDTIEKLIYENGKVFINTEQYFGNVSEIAWNFYIGGYQPAQKWLKDRKGRTLTNSDIEHYQKIIVALVETNRIMREIDKVLN